MAGIAGAGGPVPGELEVEAAEAEVGAVVQVLAQVFEQRAPLAQGRGRGGGLDPGDLVTPLGGIEPPGCAAAHTGGLERFIVLLHLGHEARGRLGTQDRVTHDRVPAAQGMNLLVRESDIPARVLAGEYEHGGFRGM
jgi:hypothetical protein